MVGSKAKCRLIIDSCSDLPLDVVEAAGVDCLKFPFIMNDGEHKDDFWKTMAPKEFYDRMRKGEVSGTAQVPIPEITEHFEMCAKDGTPTVYLGFSSALSGTFATIEQVAEDIRAKYPDFELYVVDTKLAAIAEGLLAYEAINQRDRGLTAKQLADWATEARWFVNCLFTVDELEYLRRGGRIPSAAATIGSKLNIKPLLAFSLDGSLSLVGVARGRKKSLKALVKCYDEGHEEHHGSNSVVLVGSADSDGDAKWVEEHLDRPEEALPAVRCTIGPVIGSHVGPGMVAVSFWGSDRREKISIADRIANKVNSGDESDD